MLIRIKILALALIFNIITCSLAFAENQTVDPKLRQLLTEAINSSDSFDDRFHAEVWLLDMSNRLQRYVKDEKTRLFMLKQIHLEATRAKLQPELVLALIEVESHFDSYAISKSGAQGMMQVMPFWLNEIGHPSDNLIKIKTNLRMGCTILKYYMDMENNDLHKALARYNGSRGSKVYSNKVLLALRNHWYQS
ncbi:FIG016425: Soluble lytic murein transglycosylase and related regulatory proteins (some contain LysM/invasin domains) [hydrothermal vent metagenome]|uniref:FIG016425: Soluble lytic murein transglycosylase and related regulatory proteins (Some contain LysM/invasin domains) n=1 Tax=hydrothermal vent metagenome TaxID=652676 RepID=A0A3B0WNN3_9ZZZZ